SVLSSLTFPMSTSASLCFFLFVLLHLSSFFFCTATATTEIYTLSLHDALPIFPCRVSSDLHEWRNDFSAVSTTNSAKLHYEERCSLRAAGRKDPETFTIVWYWDSGWFV